MKLVLTCDEATAICDKNQYGEAKLSEKLKLTLHLIFCKKCGMYSKQNGVMTKCYEHHKDKLEHKDCCLSDEEKKCMCEEVNAKL